MADLGADEREFWERRADAWERRADTLDLFSGQYGSVAMEALDPQVGDRVLDIGCGPGTTAVELARRVGPTGQVVALDISESMVAAATRRAERAGATNLDVVIHDLDATPVGEGFDGAYSRFGVMFFPDPVAAFTNIAASLRPGGRLAAVVWSALGDNPWMFVPTLAASGPLAAELPLPDPDQPGPFSLADPDRILSLLEAAGFVDGVVTTVTGERVISGATGEDDLRMLLEVGPLGTAYGEADDGARQAAVDAVIEALEPYRSGDGWALPGSALVLGASRPSA